MTGNELIQWIVDNKAQDMEILIEHRDSGGTYRTAEHLGEYGGPKLVLYRDESYGTIYTIIWETQSPNAVIL